MATAQDLAPIPPLQARVNDLSQTLSALQRQALEGKLAAFEAQTGTQIAVLLVPSTGPEDISAYAWRVADAWKLGRREVGDGVLIVVAVADHRLRIEVAKSLEGAVPDLAAKRIITQQINPAFKRGDYAGGLNAGVDALMLIIRGEGLPAPAPNRPSGSGLLGGHSGDEGLPWLWLLLALPLLGGVLRGVLGRPLGALAAAGGAAAGVWWLSQGVVLALGAGLVAGLWVGLGGRFNGEGGHGGLRSRRGSGPVIWTGGGGWTGGVGSVGGGHGGDGGFASGGGGDFGGGGASGDW